MPIPRQIQKEFFIPNINSSYLFEDYNQAIIYEPLEPISYLSIFARLISNSTFWQMNVNYNNKFVSDVMKIFSKTLNDNNISSSQNFDQFKSHIIHFSSWHAGQDILDLSFNLYLKIPTDTYIMGLFGPEITKDFQKNILNYYYKLLRILHFQQFKEFKVHQSYIEKKLNYQMKMKIKVRNHFIYQYKYRKIKYLHTTI